MDFIRSYVEHCYKFLQSNEEIVAAFKNLNI